MKLTGMFAGSLVVAPLGQTRSSAAQQQMGSNLNIGILASQSTLNPGAAERWIAGVQNGLSQLGNSYAGECLKSDRHKVGERRAVTRVTPLIKLPLVPTLDEQGNSPP